MARLTSEETVVVSARSPRLWLFDDFLEGEGPWLSRLRKAFVRSSPTLFADIGSDYLVLYRSHLLRKVSWRLLIITAGIGVSVALMGVGWQTGLVAALLLWALSRDAIVPTVGAVALSPFLGGLWWLPFVLISGAALHRKVIDPAREIAAGLGGWRPIALLPLRESVILIWRRSRFTVASVLDLAEAGFPARASETLGSHLDASLQGCPNARAMIGLARALVSYEEGKHSLALELAEAARKDSVDIGAGPRAWILLGQARLVANLGDPLAARALTAEAIALAPRRAKGLALDTQIEAALLAHALKDGQSEFAAIHAARLISLSQRNVTGLVLTELALLQTQDESTEVRSEVLEWLVSFARMEYRNAVLIPSDVVGSIEAVAAEMARENQDDGETANHYARAAAAYSRAHNPVREGMVLTRFAQFLGTPGLKALAEGVTPAEQRADALNFALMAVRNLNAVRYELPTTSWRHAWTNAVVESYSVALRIAIDAAQAPIAAGLIELGKSQAVPTSPGGNGDSRQGLLDSFLEARAKLLEPAGYEMVSADARSREVRALLSANPVQAALTPIVAGKRVLAETTDAGLDIDRAIRDVAGGQAFYLSGLLTSTEYFWSFRERSGRWTVGRVDVSAGSPAGDALHRLIEAVPVRFRLETSLDYARRVAASPLLHNADAIAVEREATLLQAAGAALIPAEVGEALRGQAGLSSERPRLLVSMAGVLAAIPLAFLGVADGRDAQHDERLIELADVQTLPSLQLGAAVASRPPIAAESWPIRLAGAFPMPGAEEVDAPPWVDRVVDEHCPPDQRKERLRTALLEFAAGSTGGTLYLSGHLEPARSRGWADPLRTGLQLAVESLPDDGGYLTVADLMRSPSDGGFPIAERLLLLACSSTGIVLEEDELASTAGDQGPRWPLVGEWTGFGAACLLAGARTAVCTHFDQVDSRAATVLDHKVARMLEVVDDPVRGLGAIQRGALEDWRLGRVVGPAITAMPYTIISC